MRWLVVGGLALGLVVLGAWRLDTASGQGTVTKVVSPSTWPADGGSFEVQIRIESVANLGSYEWQLTFDPAVIQFVDVVDGGFLGSTGRTLLFCGKSPYVDPAQGSVRFGCATGGATAGPSGSGLLSKLTFSPVADGTSPLELGWVSLSDTSTDVVDLPSSRSSGCIAIGTGATCATPTVAPPATPTPPVAGTPSAPTPTPAGPLPPATPLPPGLEAIALVAGCQFVAWTGADGTTPADLSALVGPAENLRSLWAQQPAPIWRGYSPQFPQVSDMEPVHMLDVVAICMNGSGEFVRPLI